ncbi:MAG: hypothetical protein AAF503_09960 [Pseudomonadota bacterium]
MKRIACSAMALTASATGALAHAGPHNEPTVRAAVLHFLTDPYHVVLLLVGVAIGGGLCVIAGLLRRH